MLYTSQWGQVEVSSDIQILQFGKEGYHLDIIQFALISFNSLNGISDFPDLIFLFDFHQIRLQFLKTVWHIVEIKKVPLVFDRFSDHFVVDEVLHLLTSQDRSRVDLYSTAIRFIAFEESFWALLNFDWIMNIE